MTDDHVALSAWPPCYRSEILRNAITLGTALGATEGGVLGAVCGIPDGRVDYGSLAGSVIGLIYGGLTGWVYSKLRDRSKAYSRVRFVPMLSWPIGALIIAFCTVELVRLGDTHEFWSLPLLFIGLPFVMALIACIVELVISESKRHPDAPTTDVVDLLNNAQYCVSYAARKWVCAVLQAAIMEGASEIRVERNGRKGRLLYKIDNNLKETVPPPASVYSYLIREITTQAKLTTRRFSARLRLWLSRMKNDGSELANVGKLRLRILERVFEVEACHRLSWHIEVLTLTLPEELRSEDMKIQVAEMVEARRMIPESPIKHVYRGRTNYAIASIATVTGMSYDEVLAKWPYPKAKNTPMPKDILGLLKSLTGVQWQTIPLNAHTRRLYEFAFPKWPILVLIRRPWGFCDSHCIVVCEKIIHDPGWRKPCLLDYYEGKTWIGRTAFQPIRTEKE